MLVLLLVAITAPSSAVWVSTGEMESTAAHVVFGKEPVDWSAFVQQHRGGPFETNPPCGSPTRS